MDSDQTFSSTAVSVDVEVTQTTGLSCVLSTQRGKNSSEDFKWAFTGGSRDAVISMGKACLQPEAYSPLLPP